MRFRTYSQILSGVQPENPGTAKVVGSSLTIPGQGCDLMQIIESIVKLPPLDERSFDTPSGQDPDIRSLQADMDLQSMYVGDGVAFAEAAKSRIEERRKLKQEQTKKEEGEGMKVENDDNA